MPNPAELRLLFAARKFVRLNRLKASALSWSLDSRHGSGKDFASAKSTWRKGYPMTLLRFASPNGWLGSVGRTTFALSK